MANRNRRPHRGPRDGRNVLISGDVPGDLGTREPQGGARPVRDFVRESGDLEAREFGVPQADIPGGVRHLVNPETVPTKPPATYERPADYHKYHGVESDDGQYYPPPGDVGKPRSTVAVPKVSDAIPVYIVEEASDKHTRRVATTNTIQLPAVGTDPVRICNRDDNRDEIMMLCTDATHDALFSDLYGSLADATATTKSGCGFLSHSATTYTRVAGQNELWGTSADASPSHLTYVIITRVASG